MALFGWIVLCIVMIVICLNYLAWGFMCLGTYNIGGVPNKLGEKLAWLFTGAFLIYGWWWIFSIAPLQIITK